MQQWENICERKGAVGCWVNRGLRFPKPPRPTGVKPHLRDPNEREVNSDIFELQSLCSHGNPYFYPPHRRGAALL